jgi:hypothetical protein
MLYGFPLRGYHSNILDESTACHSAVYLLQGYRYPADRTVSDIEPAARQHAGGAFVIRPRIDSRRDAAGAVDYITDDEVDFHGHDHACVYIHMR